MKLNGKEEAEVIVYTVDDKGKLIRPKKEGTR